MSNLEYFSANESSAGIDEGELLAAIVAKDLRAIFNLVPSVFSNEHAAISREFVRQSWLSSIPDENALMRAVDVLFDWLSSLQPSSSLDIFERNQWYAARVVRSTEEWIEIHFNGWSTKHNKKVPRFSGVLAPLHFRSAEKQRKVPSRQKKVYSYTVLEQNTSENDVPNTVDRSSKRQCRVNHESNLNPPAKRANKRAVKKDQHDILCFVCRELETSEIEDVLLCDGKCLRVFHESCLGFTPVESEDGKWFCEDCKNGEHLCGICHTKGKDSADGGVFPCSVATCAAFYHVRCVDESPCASAVSKKNTFTCPRHKCDTCESESGPSRSKRSREANSRMKIKEVLHSCLCCPAAFHERCVPPGTRFNELGLLCPRHPDDSLPRLPTKSRDPLKAEAFLVNGEGVNKILVDSKSKCLKSVQLPCKKCNLKFHRQVIREVYSVVPEYKQIDKLFYGEHSSNLERRVEEDMCAKCDCKQNCIDNCLNAATHIECISPEMEGSTEIEEQYRNCERGPECGNRKFQLKKYMKTKEFREEGRGWGLKTLEDIPTGGFICEYVGEVIDEEEMQSRLRDAPNESNHYVMELDNGIYVDAKNMGNKSRFINHSCDPNCEIQKWDVAGYNRIGIVAIRNIKKGESLSYDYKFFTKDSSKFQCNCGKQKCRGTMAPKKMDFAKISTLKSHKKRGRKGKEAIFPNAVIPEPAKALRAPPRDRSQVPGTINILDSGNLNIIGQEIQVSDEGSRKRNISEVVQNDECNNEHSSSRARIENSLNVKVLMLKVE